MNDEHPHALLSASPRSLETTAWLLPGGYRLRRQIATTHFSSVWVATVPSCNYAGTPGRTEQQVVGAEAGVQGAGRGRQRTGVPAHPHEPEAEVVIKAVDASRPTHAAIAANEAAALRRLATVAASATPAVAVASPHAATPSTRSAAVVSSNGSGVDVYEAAQHSPPLLPFVRLLGTFTAHNFAAASAAALRAPQQPASGSPNVSRDGSAQGARASDESTPAGSAPTGRRWRCLVLERLGPTATDLLQGWQRWRWRQNRGAPKGQQEDPMRAQPLSEDRGSPARRELALGGQVGGAAARGLQPQERSGERRLEARSGGLPPAAVRCFAAHALAALDLVHRSAGLVHCDIKPDNFALRPTDQSSLEVECTASSAATTGRGSAVPQQLPRRSRLGSGSWALLDFGSACSLRDTRHEEMAQDGVRPCVPPPGGDNSDGGDSDGHAWYDTPSYAAPELALGLPPSPASDMWSLGCTVFELATGSKLLPVPPALLHGRGAAADTGSPDAVEVHLALVTQLLGRPPRELLTRAPRAGWFFDLRSRRLLLEEDFQVPPPLPLSARLRGCLESCPASVGRVPGDGRKCLGQGGAEGSEERGAVGGAGANGTAPVMRRKQEGPRRDGERTLWDAREERWSEEYSSERVWDEAEVSGLCSFLAPLLQWDPRDRPTAHVAARHPWLATCSSGSA